MLRTGQSLGRGRLTCPVCGKDPIVEVTARASDVLHDVYFRCHGSAAHYTLDVEMMNQTQIAEALLALWRRSFVDEARSPDLRELSAYNRGAVPC